MGIDPGTLTIAATVLGGISTGVQMMGQMQQASAQKAAAEYNAQVAAGNAEIARQNAVRASQAGEQQAAIKEQETRAKAGAMLAQEGASGVTVNTGSYGDVQASESKLGMLDALTIRSNAARTAYGYETQSTGFENQAAVDKATAANAETAGTINAASSLLGGTGSAASRYAEYNLRSNGMSASATPSFYDQASTYGMSSSEFAGAF